ncbi:hypothetical protein Goklo_012952 [Gossypium klotzschianum]|nr:hypothetical protein [Gossypium klotzschianum]
MVLRLYLLSLFLMSLVI